MLANSRWANCCSSDLKFPPNSPVAASSISGPITPSMKLRAASVPPSKWIAAISDSKTSASSDGGIAWLVRDPLAHDQELLQTQGLADLGTGLTADHRRLDLGQVALQVLGIPAEEQLADDGPQDRVSQELKPFVGGQPMLGAGGMRQGLPQQFLILKDVPDPPLAPLQPAGLLLVGLPEVLRPGRRPAARRLGRRRGHGRQSFLSWGDVRS